jgi:hypothetical protein
MARTRELSSRDQWSVASGQNLGVQSYQLPADTGRCAQDKIWGSQLWLSGDNPSVLGCV